MSRRCFFILSCKLLLSRKTASAKSQFESKEGEEDTGKDEHRDTEDTEKDLGMEKAKAKSIS